MSIEFGKLQKNEIRIAAELAARAFDNYEYFTNWFPDNDERKRVLFSIIWHEYKTNFRSAEYLAARQGGQLIAIAQLNPPSYKKPSDICYMLHGWLDVYRQGDKGRIDEWLEMDAEAGKPCHEFQKTGYDIWYISSLTVDPSCQGTGIGTKLIDYWENFVLERGGRQIIFFTNSKSNLTFYLRRGYEVFDERTIEHNGIIMGSWSLKKVLTKF